MPMFKEFTGFYPNNLGSLCCEILLLFFSVLLNNACFFYTLEETINGFIF